MASYKINQTSKKLSTPKVFASRRLTLNVEFKKRSREEALAERNQTSDSFQSAVARGSVGEKYETACPVRISPEKGEE